MTPELWSMDRLDTLKDLTILGLNPAVHDFAYYDLWSRPVGLLNVLGYLKAKGNRIHFLDCLQQGRTRPLTYGRWKIKREELNKPCIFSVVTRKYYRFGLNPDEITEQLQQMPRPDMILVTSIMTYWYPGVFEIIALARKVFPGVPIVLGGIYATLCPEHASKSGADFVLTGSLPRTQTQLPLPLELYPDPTCALLLTARGCPHRCHYCASAQLNPVFQPRPLPDILQDLEHQMACGEIKDLTFYDDALLWKPQARFYPLTEYLRRHHPELRLHTPNGLSVSALDERCCTTLFNCGFKTIRLSLEGIDPATEAYSKNKAGRKLYEKAVGLLLVAGYNPEAIETYLLVGLPHQSQKAVVSNIEYVKSLGARPKLAEFSPIPGTRLFEEARKKHPILALEPLWHNNSVYLTHLDRTMHPEELQNLKNMTRQARA